MSKKTKEMMPVEGLCFLDDNNKAYVAVCKDSCTKDKAITVTDAVGVVNIILGNGGAGAPKQDMKEPEVEP